MASHLWGGGPEGPVEKVELASYLFPICAKYCYGAHSMMEQV
jgi:hypothetical protein